MRSEWALNYRAVTGSVDLPHMALVTSEIVQAATTVAADHRVVRVVVDHGFDWRAALIGAAAATGIALVGVGVRRAHNQPNGDQ